MPVAPSNGIEICYETVGNPDDPALLLVMGFSAQLIHWDDAFCQTLASRGRYVIRFDNRDCGLSTHLDGVPVDIMGVLAAYEDQTEMPPVPYTMDAFSDDAFGLLDHLGIEKAHIFGASMGGMIVQAMAIAHPERVLSMVSVMSNTGEPEYSQSSPEALMALMTPPPTEREAFIKRSVKLGALVASPRYYNEERAAALAAASFDRAFYTEGAVRQMAAVRSSGDRADGLRALDLPTLVIHGRADTLVLPMGGERTAELIPGANLLMLHDMGHDLPQPLWPLIVDATISHTAHRIGGAPPPLPPPAPVAAPAPPPAPGPVAAPAPVSPPAAAPVAAPAPPPAPGPVAAPAPGSTPAAAPASPAPSEAPAAPAPAPEG